MGNKDFQSLIEAISPCRRCGQWQMIHGGEYDTKYKVCKEYVPKDNLEYFKYLYNKLTK